MSARRDRKKRHQKQRNWDLRERARAKDWEHLSTVASLLEMPLDTDQVLHEKFADFGIIRHPPSKRVWMYKVTNIGWASDLASMRQLIMRDLDV